MHRPEPLGEDSRWGSLATTARRGSDVLMSCCPCGTPPEKEAKTKMTQRWNADRIKLGFLKMMFSYNSLGIPRIWTSFSKNWVQTLHLLQYVAVIGLGFLRADHLFEQQAASHGGGIWRNGTDWWWLNGGLMWIQCRLIGFNRDTRI